MIHLLFLNTINLLDCAINGLLPSADTLYVKIIDPINLKEKTETWWTDPKFLIPTGLSIVLFFYATWEKIKWPRISGKIVSDAHSRQATFTAPGKNHEIISFTGIQYLFKISINVIRKNVYYKDVKVYVKYPNGEKHEAKLFWARESKWVFGEQEKLLKIPKDKFLFFNNVLEKERVLFYYMTFIIEKTDYSEWEEIEIIFIAPNGCYRRMQKLTSKEIRSELEYYDDEIWE